MEEKVADIFASILTKLK